MQRFADYGFNKSHAAAYALVAYQTAYLKANYPVEFLAASMTLDMDNTDKLAEFRREAERLGIAVVSPSVNRSGREFDVADGQIVYALAALRGVGGLAVDAIASARGARPFADLTDFASRMDPRAVNKRTLESLAQAGAFDCLEGNRARAFSAIDAIMAHAQRTGAAAAMGQSELFGEAGRVRPFSFMKSKHGSRRSGSIASTTRSDFSCPDTRSTTTRPRSSACACFRGTNSQGASKPGRPPAGSRQAWCRASSVARAPAARWGYSVCRIQPDILRR